MDQSGDDTCQFLPRGMPRRLKFDVDQSAIDTCHMCHVAVRPTLVGPSRGCCANPPTHPPPTTYPGVFGKFPGCSEVPGTFGEVSGVFGNFRVFLESSGCFREVPGVFGKFPGFIWKVPGVFGKFPGCFGKFRHVFGSSRVLSFGIQKTRFAILRLQKNQIQSKNS